MVAPGLCTRGSPRILAHGARARPWRGVASSLFPLTRWSFVGRAGEDERELGLLVAHYADAVARYLARRFPELARRGEIDDLVQEVLLALLRNGAVLRRADPAQGGRFRYFLMRVAYNAARNARRRLVRRDWSLLADEAVAETGTEAGPAPGADMDRAWAQSVLQRAWNELRAWADEGAVAPESVALLEATLLRDRSLRQAAGELGLSLGTAHRRLAAAKRNLRRAILDHLRFAGETGPDEEERAYRTLLEAASE